MNEQLKTIKDFILGSEAIAEAEKKVLLKAVSDTDKQLSIVEFKLDRTEKVKRTTAILLEETIDELEQKRKSIEETNSALNKSLEELKAAQAQLVQSEKMASLGELTAGIAHEIQNPLNFVNNFSEVSKELLDEMKAALVSGDQQEAAAIADDVIVNLEKINHHGKRADGIVKGMLQHSRTGTGQKELTDLNVLTDEYLRLSYHGIRARNKTFNATLNTDFDSSIGQVEIIPQDFGRVILNILNNAFYAVDEKAAFARSAEASASASALGELSAVALAKADGYQPAVSVSTKKMQEVVQVIIADNGKGIPQKMIDKIFQPFFTTKPTGQGTGLGLSLAYDIVKAHGGELKVNTTEGEGTTFIIQLPFGTGK